MDDEATNDPTACRFAVVCIDAVGHGERRPVAAGEGLPRGSHSRVMPQMVADRQAVVGHLSSVEPPLAYVGFSMGALFGLATVAAMASITATRSSSVGFPAGAGPTTQSCFRSSPPPRARFGIRTT
ncbi:MAG: hypothetical protein M0Z33_00540 [Actinomycetota bacterium]|nr:hypothetical protein [Actinomycetota bacterium]